jgi:hypothetical protein
MQVEIQRITRHYISEVINLMIIAFIITVEDKGSTFLQNVCDLLQDYTVSRPIRLVSVAYIHFAFPHINITASHQ